MATIFSRFKKLGIPRSNLILGIVGDHVSDFFLKNQPLTGEWTRQQTSQIEEDGKVYYVWNYCENFIPTMDVQILKFIQGQRDGQTDKK